MTPRCASATRFSACSATSSSAPSSAPSCRRASGSSQRRTRRRAACSGSSSAPWRKAAAPARHCAGRMEPRTSIDKLAAESPSPLKSGIRVIRTTRDVLHVPRIDSDPAAAWTAEARHDYPERPGLYRHHRDAAEARDADRHVSNELIADSNPDVVALLEKQMARALALKFDLGVLRRQRHAAGDSRAEERRRHHARCHARRRADEFRPVRRGDYHARDEQRDRDRDRDASAEAGARC